MTLNIKIYADNSPVLSVTHALISDIPFLLDFQSFPIVIFVIDLHYTYALFLVMLAFIPDHSIIFFPILNISIVKTFFFYLYTKVYSLIST